MKGLFRSVKEWLSLVRPSPTFVFSQRQRYILFTLGAAFETKQRLGFRDAEPSRSLCNTCKVKTHHAMWFGTNTCVFCLLYGKPPAMLSRTCSTCSFTGVMFESGGEVLCPACWMHQISTMSTDRAVDEDMVQMRKQMRLQDERTQVIFEKIAANAAAEKAA